MFSRIVSSGVVTLTLLCGFTGAAAAESWNAEQQEVWTLEKQQWKMAAANSGIMLRAAEESASWVAGM